MFSSSDSEILNIVIFDGNTGHDWKSIFTEYEKKINFKYRLIQCSWMETAITTFIEPSKNVDEKKETCLMKIAPVFDSLSDIRRPETITIKPNFLIIRNQCRALTEESDKRDVLYGLMISDIPSINTLQSMYQCLERPIMYAGLRTIEKKLGSKKFPLIPFNYHSSYQQMIISPEMPCVVKVGHAHRGMGKMKVSDTTQWADLRTIIALNDTYSTCEPFIDVAYGIRIQKIGKNYRAFKKEMSGSGWKSHFGGSSLVEMELKDEHKLWVDECAKQFDLDLCAVDALCDKNGKEYIIELNDSAIGFTTGFWVEDTRNVVELAIEKIKKIYK
ncbi:hypothetical protein ABK040_009353 [Willaertia magna]